jgi:hypothetical protein
MDKQLFLNLDPDPNPHSLKKLNPEQDLLKVDANAKHLLVINTSTKSFNYILQFYAGCPLKEAEDAIRRSVHFALHQTATHATSVSIPVANRSA